MITQTWRGFGLTDKIAHLDAFLGSEKRRRWEEFQDTRIMPCWKCMEVIDEIAKAHGLVWNKEEEEFEEDSDKLIKEYDAKDVDACVLSTPLNLLYCSKEQMKKTPNLCRACARNPR
jgi:hypothetical protein